MSKTPSSLAAAVLGAALALSACTEDHNITAADNDPQAEALKKAGPVAAPPMIQASRTYRCKDNSLVYVDFYTNSTARIRTAKDGPATALAMAEGAAAYTAEGYSVSGNSPQVTVTAPGKGTQSCKASRPA